MKLGGVPRGGFHVLSLAFCAASACALAWPKSCRAACTATRGVSSRVVESKFVKREIRLSATPLAGERGEPASMIPETRENPARCRVERSP